VREAIVTGYDGSDGAHDAAALAQRLSEASGRELVLVCVHPPGPPDPWERALAAAPAPAGVERRLVAEESVAGGLRRFAESIAASAIVVGCPDRTRPGGIEAGTVAERLLHGSPCAIALAPRGYATAVGDGFHRIVVGYTPSDEARAALRAAAGLAQAAGATVRVVSVVTPPPAWSADPPGYDAAARARLHADLDRSLRVLASRVQVEGHVLDGDPVERLLEQASGWADLIISGSRGHGPARQVELGSVSAGLLARAEVPVLVMPRGAEFELVAPALAGVGG
jgi:nucleotide-binding universal stress UspA family protein